LIERITRRDFLDGIALTIAAGAAPLDLLAQDSASPTYPPALTGLRGQNAGSFEVAHGTRFEGDRYRVGDPPRPVADAGSRRLR
jgi:spermidine dehydrogenase